MDCTIIRCLGRVGGLKVFDGLPFGCYPEVPQSPRCAYFLIPGQWSCLVKVVGSVSTRRHSMARTTARFGCICVASTQRRRSSSRKLPRPSRWGDTCHRCKANWWDEALRCFKLVSNGQVFSASWKESCTHFCGSRRAEGKLMHNSPARGKPGNSWECGRIFWEAGLT